MRISHPCAAQVYVQFYKFLRLGRAGYATVCDNMMAVAAHIRAGLAKMTRDDGTPFVKLLDTGDERCLPVVAAMVNPDLGAPYDDVDLQHAIAKERWYVCGYKMNFVDPLSEAPRPLFT